MNASIDPFGKCMKCGRYVESTAGCNCDQISPQPKEGDKKMRHDPYEVHPLTAAPGTKEETPGAATGPTVTESDRDLMHQVRAGWSFSCKSSLLQMDYNEAILLTAQHREQAVREAEMPLRGRIVELDDLLLSAYETIRIRTSDLAASRRQVEALRKAIGSRDWPGDTVELSKVYHSKESDYAQPEQKSRPMMDEEILNEAGKTKQTAIDDMTPKQVDEALAREGYDVDALNKRIAEKKAQYHPKL